jgi:hypothetical protein
MAAFTKVAVDNVAMLAAEVRKGNDIVVPQPTCSYVLKKTISTTSVAQMRNSRQSTPSTQPNIS